MLKAVMICGGGGGGTLFPYYFCSGNTVPFEKNQGWRNVVPPEQNKNGGTLFPVKTNKAVGPYSL